jgi:hypothetical protein
MKIWHFLVIESGPEVLDPRMPNASLRNNFRVCPGANEDYLEIRDQLPDQLTSFDQKRQALLRVSRSDTRLAVDQLEADCLTGEPVPKKLEKSTSPLRQGFIHNSDALRPPHICSETAVSLPLEHGCRCTVFRQI